MLTKSVGRGELVSIAISALTTGFTSALIAFDCDVDVSRRKKNPKLNGYIPDDHAARGRCFFLMMLISALHNLSRSVGCALLAASSSDKSTLLVYFMGGEMILYLAFKAARGDFYYFLRLEGFFGFVVSLLDRIFVKVIVDFSGCFHMRHP